MSTTTTTSTTEAPVLGPLVTWGYNGYGSAGDNTTINRSTPTQELTLSNWIDISLCTGGYGTNLAIKQDGTLWGWGNDVWILTSGASNHKSSPIMILPTGTSWQSVSAGRYNGSGIKTDGTLWYWGRSHSGPIPGTGSSSPIQVGPDTTWTSVSLGEYNGVALKQDGTLWMWGELDDGQSGNNIAHIDYASPTQTVTGSWKKAIITTNSCLI